MLKHHPQQLLLKSEKYFMKLVGHRGRRRTHSFHGRPLWPLMTRSTQPFMRSDRFLDWRAAFYTPYDLRSTFTKMIQQL
jgi:hypothetical protein